MHPRNKHHDRYDFNTLILSSPSLATFVKHTDYGDESIDFFDPKAVKALNKALLKQYYDVANWDIPANYLCPPIPGRADYIHHIADHLAESYSKQAEKKIPAGDKIKCLDVGVGANCIYPIIGIKEYGWSFIGSDIDPVAIQSASQIVKSNPSLAGKIKLRLQNDPKEIFNGILNKNEFVDVSICNPPFHGSAEEARTGSKRKLENLKHRKTDQPVLNFGGQNNELWCNGGEERFVRNMVFQSKDVAFNCFWFTSLVAKQVHLKRIYNAIEKVEATDVKTILMGQGNKTSRIVAWTFLTKNQQDQWIKER